MVRTATKSKTGTMLVGNESEFQCENCGFVGPATQFYEPSMCRQCRKSLFPDKPKGKAGMEEYRAHQKQEIAAAAARELLGSRRNGFVTSPHACDLANAIINEFGSIDLFAKSWFNSIQIASAQDPGSQKVLRAHEQIGRLIIDAHKLAPEMSNLDDLSDEDIEQQLQEILLDRFKSGKIRVSAITGNPEDDE